MKKFNVRAHIRKIGRKYTKVRSHKRSVEGKPEISTSQRRLFTAMASMPYEVGGQLDFEGKRLENARAYFGDAQSLEYEYNPDYEISYHTHPLMKGSSIMPSYYDIKNMQETKEKEQVIFSGHIALSIAEKKKFNNISRKKMQQVNRQLEKDYYNGFTDKMLYTKYKPIFLKELGLNMKWHEKNAPIKFETRSV